MLAAVALASTVAVAQTETTPARRAPVVQNVVKEPISTQYCVYEDKRYSEGAIKTFDGVKQICMERDSVMAKMDGEPQQLVWESANSFRGRLVLGQKSAGAAKK
jgi:hypothetical protein